MFPSGTEADGLRPDEVTTSGRIHNWWRELVGGECRTSRWVVAGLLVGGDTHLLIGAGPSVRDRATGLAEGRSANPVDRLSPYRSRSDFVEPTDSCDGIVCRLVLVAA